MEDLVDAEREVRWSRNVTQGGRGYGCVCGVPEREETADSTGEPNWSTGEIETVVKSTGL